MLMSTFFRNDFVRKCLANHILGGTKKMEGRSACERSVQWITGLQVEGATRHLSLEVKPYAGSAMFQVTAFVSIYVVAKLMTS